MKWSCLVLPLVAFAGGMMGCTSSEPPQWYQQKEARRNADETIGSGPKQEGLTRSGLYRVSYLTVPAPPVAGELFEVKVTVLDASSGKPVAGARVEVDARMPAHGHGMETAPVTSPDPQRAGVYETQGMKFHMPGEWTILVDIGGGARPDRIEFPYIMP